MVFKRSDIIVIVAIFACCVLLFSVMLSKNNGKNIKVTVDREQYAVFSLNKNAEHKIKTEKGSNTLVIYNGECYFKDSDCFDKTCQKTGKIKNIGESIVCLPHRVIAEVVE